MQRKLWRALGLLLICLALPLQANAASPRLSDSQRLARIERVTEQIRGLKPARGVLAKFPSDTAFNAELRREISLDTPDSELDISQRESVLLGLLKKSDSLRKIVYQGLANEVVGVYDPRGKVLYVRKHANRVFGVDRYVLAHEYTHALQDQHWNLRKLLPDQYPLTYRNSDAVGAHHALTEGDATNLQYLFISKQYSASEIRQLIKESTQQPTPSVPKAMQRQFTFPYDTGLNFVRTLYGAGGMKAVNAAYSRLPSSTYEIMHPQAYLKHWKPANPTLHGVKGFDDWKQVDDDVFGAFGYKLLIWQFSSQRAATTATDSYRGDRYLFLEKGDQDAMLLRSAWTTSKTARAAVHAISISLRSRFHGGAWTQNGTLLTYSGGAVYLKATGARVTLAYAPSADIAVKLATAGTT